MTCKEAEKLIPLFLDDDLDNEELAGFISHIEGCEECREELTIQFLVKIGMKRLEDGNTFNLRQELDVMLKEAKKRLNGRKRLVFVSYLLELTVAALAIVTLVLAIAL